MNPRHLSTADRKLLDESIASKWDGVRVMAARVLCRAGETRGIERVRSALVAMAEQPSRRTTARLLAAELSQQMNHSKKRLP